MLNNKTFYPTPKNLVSKMLAKVQGRPKKVLEPSAGKGDIIDAIKDTYSYDWRKSAEVSAIEIDENLQATLRGKGIKVIDTDFLDYAGPDKYDLIIANPPFDDGDKHLLKAIDVMYRGEIVFLLNAETIRNPFTNTRKILAQKLDGLGAEIEYIQKAFISSERTTGVEVALVYIKIDRNVEEDLFSGADDHATRSYQTVKDSNEVATGKTVAELVAEYNQIIQVGQDTILGYFRNFRKVGKYIGLNKEAKEQSYSSDDLTNMMQNALNDLLKVVRTDFWRRILDLKEVRTRMTKKKMSEFETALTERCHMDFTENNIRQFVLNLIGGYEQTLIDAVLDIFDMFTVRHSWNEGVHEKNIHYFNGWKTNSAFKVGKRVVIPIRAGYGSGPFLGYSGQWDLNYGAAEILRDIDLVMSYFDGCGSYHSMSDALKSAFARGECSGIQSTYFKMTPYKKGTIHLTFRDEDILRRFNVVACRGKGWLPGDFGTRKYNQLDHEEKAVVDTFEGAASYDKNVSKPLFRVSGFQGQRLGFNLETTQADQQALFSEAA